MAEGAEETVFGDGIHHGGADGDLAPQFIRAAAQLRTPLAVQAQITQGEVHLSQGAKPGIEGSTVQKFAEFLLGQGFTGLPMERHAHQGAAIEAPVLHELAGELHRIPFHVADACSLRLLNGGEHVLQAMAELVEEGLHLFKAHQAGNVPHRRGLIADQIGHRKNEAAIGATLAAEAFIHPGPTAFAGGSAEGIEVEPRDRLASPQDFVVAHIVMPQRSGWISRADVHVKQA
ncbi:MAG: Uncharacterised protein [Synechococcus sp. CC9902]|nr:MAG: Uncharacterised protein [Synechococcus sp. CC9902]